MTSWKTQRQKNEKKKTLTVAILGKKTPYYGSRDKIKCVISGS